MPQLSRRKVPLDLTTMLNFQDTLRQIYWVRKKRNPKYSLRAYGRQLGISHATLSHLISGQREISPKTLERLAPRLGMGPDDLESYKQGLRRATMNKTKISFVKEEVFQLIQDWRHDAILELLQTHSLLSQDSMAGKLEILRTNLPANLFETKQMVRRLQEQGAVDQNLQVTPDWENSTNILSSEQTSAAARNYQADLLSLSQTALEEIAIENRYHTSLMVAITAEDFGWLKKEIQNFRRRINRKITAKKSSKPSSKPSQKLDVAILQFTGFPLSKLMSRETLK